jgi:hypothetical protein
MKTDLKRRFFATYYDTPARVVYGGEDLHIDLHIEADGWWPGLLEGDLTSYYLLLEKFEHWKYCMSESTIKEHGELYFYDHLRADGVATNFMNFSVQDLIDLGWIRLK